MDAFYNNLRLLLPDNDARKLTIRWVLEHIGITGNKAANERAKRAARGIAPIEASLPKSLRTSTANLITLPHQQVVSSTEVQLQNQAEDSTNHDQIPPLCNPLLNKSINLIKTLYRHH